MRRGGTDVSIFMRFRPDPGIKTGNKIAAGLSMILNKAGYMNQKGRILL